MRDGIGISLIDATPQVKIRVLVQLLFLINHYQSGNHVYMHSRLDP